MKQADSNHLRSYFPTLLTETQKKMYREIEKIVKERRLHLDWSQQRLFFRESEPYLSASWYRMRISPPKSWQESLSALRLLLTLREHELDAHMKPLLSCMPLLPAHEVVLKKAREAEWSKKLEEAVKAVEAKQEKARLRLLLQEDGAWVQICLSPEQPFIQANQTQLRRVMDEYFIDDIYFEPWTSQIIQGLTEISNNGLEKHYAYYRQELVKTLGALLKDSEASAGAMVFADDVPVRCHRDFLIWSQREKNADEAEFFLVKADGASIPPPWVVIPGRKSYVLLPDGFHPVRYWPHNMANMGLPWVVPKSVVFSQVGHAFLKKMAIPLPGEMAEQLFSCAYQVQVKCWMVDLRGMEFMRLQAESTLPTMDGHDRWVNGQWVTLRPPVIPQGKIIDVDESIREQAVRWVGQLPMRLTRYRDLSYEEMRVTKSFPDQFVDWMNQRPRGVEVYLDRELNDLLHGHVSGSVSLEIEESTHGLDWFDIKVQVNVSDTTLTDEEISLLLKAKGKWVKLGKKGWRKLDYLVSEEMQQELAEIGLSAHDLQGEKQKLHALQLGALAKRRSSLLPEADLQRVSLRLEDIQTRVTPAVPSAVDAQLRPYQQEGYHFLAYLTANQFGGVLADDMGLGKTLQALTWLVWLREKHRSEKKTEPRPSLVIAPKSVQENWQAEVRRFCAAMRVRVGQSGDKAQQFKEADFDLLVVNYAQLRQWCNELTAIAWQAVIVDEAQNIKNPTSQSTQVVRSLHAEQRLALTGTPIENRLMDLWSIFSFAMPGVLGTRAAFSKRFDKSNDPLARKRLSALTRPFLLRRTKNEVAQDLPDRIEEDISVILEGEQAKLYQAELKRARAHLLKAKIPGKLDQMRFHLLTSLLRLRQICCHPSLLGVEDGENAEVMPKKRTKKVAKEKGEVAVSAKLEALMELLASLMEEGQKVLVFSQFVGMLDLIQQELVKREWRNFYLSGQTDGRGALVEEFQQCEESAVFLISLKAGGAGLNLTSASYVVLFDPWWNPAVEAQAIDRTHRIGQKSTVIAYRLVAKDTIEEKIRQLQQHKSAMAQDILGEENFARALSIDDFQYLLSSDPVACSAGDG